MDLWLKVLHVISIIAWMAGLLYLPRLYVYHCNATPGSELADTLKIMERRLLKAIMTPAMIASWIFGLWLAVRLGYFSEGWFHVKLLFVVTLTIFHMMLAKWRKDFESDKNERSQRFYRFANEVPTILMIGIVILVIVQPF